MNIEFSRIYMLLLIPLLMGFLYYTSKKYKSNSKKRRITLINRVIIFLLLALALSDINIKLNNKETSTVFLMDVSDSAKEFTSEGEKFISESIENMPKNNKGGVVVFGENTSVEQFLSKNNSFKSVATLPVATSTNIENALTSAIGILPQEGAKRIVLITDGEENQGDMLKTLPSLKEQNVDLKVYKISKNKQDEVYVEDVKLPESINLGEEFSIVATIKSNVKTSGKLSLFSGREKKGEQLVEVEKGKNTFVFKDKQISGGFKGYRVRFEPEKDTESKNNEYMAFTDVRAKAKVLLIEGKKGEGDGAEVMLKAMGADYKKITPVAAPRSLNELTEYKTIITTNVHKDDLSNEFLNNIEAYVKDYGGGYIATGGEDSFALGAYKDTPLEKILPVNMDMKGKKEIPEMSIIMVIDHSGSMGGGSGGVDKLELAKEAASKAIDNFRNTDTVGVLAFDDSYSWVVKPQKVTDKKDIKNSIGSIGVNGGTSIYPALEEAYKAQKESKAKIKHIILLTDGQDGFHEYDDLMKKINEENISLSTVAVGDDSDKQMLKVLAEEGKGRNYYTDMYTDIPRIFAKEIFLSAKVYLNNREFAPKITSSHGILKNVLEEGKIPTLLGYIGTSKKDKATNILTSDEDDPILSAWQYGLGKTVAWTSDLSGKWSGNFLSWSKNLQLWKNILDFSITNYDEDGALKITQQGTDANIEFTTKEVNEELKVQGVYNTDAGESGEVSLEEKEPGKYVGKVKLKDFGLYNFNIRKEIEGKVEGSINGAFAMQYSPEYKTVENTESLDNLVSESSGAFIKMPEEVFEGKIKNVATRTNLTTLFVILAMLLFFMDIVYRRLNINISKVSDKLGISELKGKINEQAQKKQEKTKFKTEKVKVEIPRVMEESKQETKKEKTEKVPKPKSENKSDKKMENQKLDTSALLKKKKDRNGV